MKRLEWLFPVVGVLPFAFSTYARGWDQYAITSGGLTSVLWVFGAILALLVIPNFFAWLAGASAPLFGANFDETREKGSKLGAAFIFLGILLVLVFLRPPDETQNGWAGLLSCLGFGVSAVALIWLYSLLTHKVMFPDKGTEGIAGEKEKPEGHK